MPVQLFGKLGANLGAKTEIEILKDKATIRDVIEILINQDPSLKPLLLKKNRLHQATILLINGHIIDRSENVLDTVLDTNDKLIVDRLGFLEIVGGG
ncbi:MAG: MoaD/ThiS family protein [Candidatus Kariarchaeaceae archaeon]